MLPSHLVPGLETLRAVNLPWLVAAALACQFAAIVVFVEKLKSVDQDVASRANKDARQAAARLERAQRAGYGLMLDLALYLLAIEIVLAFIVLGR